MRNKYVDMSEFNSRLNVGIFDVATENDAMNGVAMLFGCLLTNTAQMFSYIRTYRSPDAIKRVMGKKPEGLASNGVIQLINSGASAPDFSGRQVRKREPCVKPSKCMEYIWNG